MRIVSAADSNAEWRWLEQYEECTLLLQRKLSEQGASGTETPLLACTSYCMANWQCMRAHGGDMAVTIHVLQPVPRESNRFPLGCFTGRI